jgi:hypothetical protein
MHDGDNKLGLATQPILFTEESWPRLESLPPLVTKYQHKAKAVTKDEQLCFDICEKLVLGWSERETAKYFQVSRHTIHAMIVELERTAKLAPLKQRIAGKLGLVAELSLDESIRALREGRVQTNVLPIMSGVALDKKTALEASAGADGPATTTPITAEDVRAAFARVLPAQPVIDVETVPPKPSTDSQSTGEPPNA